MRLCELKGRFLFEANPNILGRDHVGTEEIVAWGAYYEMEKVSR